MTDTDLLQQKIRNSGYKFVFIAEKLGITYQGFLNKLYNKSEFKASEIRTLSELLSLDKEDREAIFFCA